MKKYTSLFIVFALMICFAACGKQHDNNTNTQDFNKDVTGIAHDNEGFTYYKLDPGEPDTYVSQRVEELTASAGQITVDDGVNKYVFTMADGVVSKAEYAFKFGDNTTAAQMFDFYEKNGYSAPYSAGRTDGAYLIMAFADQSPYTGLSEDDISAMFGE